ncbi:uncharacterized protein LOC133789271 [Humulus lupulus]|uniref:uncharacterized protein LOC133789271 n=1 Tax=Humulus lupulus TaxID=3486 RepID=UPI002B416060|nr:uncharacterized protein LOC133789271 [Humulus lupulus]
MTCILKLPTIPFHYTLSFSLISLIINIFSSNPSFSMEEKITTTTTTSDHYFPKKMMRFSHQKPSRSCPSSTSSSSGSLFSCKPNRTSVSLPGDYRHRDRDGADDRIKEIQYCSSGRERLKRHREEVAGRVLVPDKWGKEELMKDWIDYSSFDKLLAPTGLTSAREALVVDAGRRRNGASSSSTQPSSPTARIENRCY